MSQADAAGSPIAQAVQAIAAALGEASGANAWALSGAEVLTVLRGVLSARAGLDGLLLAVLREAEGRGVPAEVGARDAAGLLRELGRLDPAEARELAELARVADPDGPADGRSCPGVGAGMRGGAVNRGQARVITKALRELPAAAATTLAPTPATGTGGLDEAGDSCTTDDPGGTLLGDGGPAGATLVDVAEALLVEQAGMLDPVGLRTVARHVHERVVQLLGVVDVDDPAEAAQVAEEAERNAYAQRALRPPRRHGPGLTFLGLVLPDEMAAALLTGVDAHAAPRPADDGYRDERTRRQRRADALMELTTTTGGGARPKSFPRPDPGPADSSNCGGGGAGAGSAGGASAGASSAGGASAGAGSAGGEFHPDAGEGDSSPGLLPEAWLWGRRNEDGADAEGDRRLRPQPPPDQPPPDQPGEPLMAGGSRVALVTLSYEALRASAVGAGMLATGEVLPPGQLRRMLCDALLLPVVLDGRSQPLDLGRGARLFTPAQKRAMLVRDGGCFGLGCDPHPHRVEAHHFRQWVHGGRTDLAAGGLVCEFWHRKIHAEGWEARLGRNGHPELVPPAWIDPARRPRQNHRYRTPRLTGPDPPDTTRPAA